MLRHAGHAESGHAVDMLRHAERVDMLRHAERVDMLRQAGTGIRPADERQFTGDVFKCTPPSK
jgi:hypothetical protein